uniref:MADS-box domain-containing protein n=1 Tax=Kalanchoe fedtschenkoi TaxID=63787 RepID=A0A7N0V9X4_KALFE
MRRQKFKLAFIANNSARKATYKKRKRGLIKKVNELSTLCGVDACAIIYSPYETHPVVWPPSAIGVQRVLSQFTRMPEMEQSKTKVNQETFLRHRIVKTKEQLKKQVKDNREEEMTEVMFQCLTGKDMMNLNMTDLNDITWLVDHCLREINKKCEKLKNSGRDAGTANVVGADPILEEIKPLILNVNPNFSTGFNPSVAADGMQSSTWLAGGFVNNNGASSSYNSNQLQGRPGIANDIMQGQPQ